MLVAAHLCRFLLVWSVLIDLGFASVTGRVFIADECNARASNFVVKFTPPATLGQQTVITATLSNGDYKVELGKPGNYYVEVFEGTRAVFGRVIPIEDGVRLDIPLQPANSRNSVCAALAVSCDEQSKLRSFNGLTPSRIQFSNETHSTRRVYWLDYSGKRIFYQTMPPGTSYTQDTYLTHPWLVTDSAGTCVGLFQPVSGSSQARITH